MTLTWESIYAIALELRRRHRDANIEEVTLKQIHDWTLELSEFEDDPALANDDILYAIYQDWYEEQLHGRKQVRRTEPPQLQHPGGHSERGLDHHD